MQKGEGQGLRAVVEAVVETAFKTAPGDPWAEIRAALAAARPSDLRRMARNIETLRAPRA